MMPFIAFSQAPGAERDQKAAIRDNTYDVAVIIHTVILEYFNIKE